MLKILLSLALVALASSCMSGCATLQGGADYHYNETTKASGDKSCDLRIDSNRVAAGNVSISACAGSLVVTGNGNLQQGQGVDLSPLISTAGAMVQQAIRGQAIVPVAPAQPIIVQPAAAPVIVQPKPTAPPIKPPGG